MDELLSRFFFDITDREFLFSTCHGYIKESSLFFDLLVCHRFPVGNCSFQRLNDINTAVLQPLSPMHRQKCGLSFCKLLFFFHLPKLIRVDLGKIQPFLHSLSSFHTLSQLIYDLQKVRLFSLQLVYLFFQEILIPDFLSRY